VSYFAFVIAMFAGAVASPFLLASPSAVEREDGSAVVFEAAGSAADEIRAAFQALNDPFIRRNLLFYLASNWFYTYNFNGFNGHQFNVRTRGLNSAVFWAAQMGAAVLFGKVLDADVAPRARAWNGMLVVVIGLVVSLGLALQISLYGMCGGGMGWDKTHPCKLDFKDDFSRAAVPMFVFLLLGAADAVYQNYAYWLMSMAAGNNVRKTVMYSAVYKGVQSLGAGVAWLIDLSPFFSYRAQGMFCLVLSLGACLPVLGTFRNFDSMKVNEL